ncbi:Protein CBG06291 [Caenorhabditis briggsae]|nr:Protein CBG06291 [Caenorhabditis briggsae]CAP26620.1 Protein CBG06291 [Caenorhabditis briggsae]
MVAMNEDRTKKVLISYAVTSGPLAICLICCLCSYKMAFTKNLRAHAGERIYSPLFPLIAYSYRNIKYLYIMFFVFGICSGIYLSMGVIGILRIFSLEMFFGMSWAITLYVATYQMVISIISIHRFISSHQSPELRRDPTRKNVFLLIVFVALLMIFKDIGIGAWMLVLAFGKDFRLEKLTTVMLYYSVVYITRQILLFIATIFQFCISEAPKSHSEYCVVTDAKYIGLVKIILGTICFASYLLNFEITIASTLFFGIDMFLVPVVVQITEIRANPNVIIPTEIQLEPLIV